MGVFGIGLLILGGGLLLLVAAGFDGDVFGVASTDFARIVKYTALAVVIGSGLLLSRRSHSNMLRSIAVWLAIVLVLMTGYQYRYELQDVASRLTAGLVPPSPLSAFDEAGRATVMMERRPNGHFEARGTIDGAPMRFLVDTGATRTVLSAADARRAGFDLGSLSFNVPVATANGTANAASVRVGEITVGGIVRRNQTVLVAADGALGESLLGMSFISTLSGFDMRGDRLVLRD